MEENTRVLFWCHSHIKRYARVIISSSYHCKFCEEHCPPPLNHPHFALLASTISHTPRMHSSNSWIHSWPLPTANNNVHIVTLRLLPSLSTPHPPTPPTPPPPTNELQCVVVWLFIQYNYIFVTQFWLAMDWVHLPCGRHRHAWLSKLLQMFTAHQSLLPPKQDLWTVSRKQRELGY